MSESRRLVLLLTFLFVVASVLTWRVAVGKNHQVCLVAFTIGTRQQGYEKVPCDGWSGYTPLTSTEPR